MGVHAPSSHVRELSIRAGGAVCVDNFCCGIIGRCWQYYSKPELQNFKSPTFSPVGIWEGNFGRRAVHSRCGVWNSDWGTRMSCQLSQCIDPYAATSVWQCAFLPVFSLFSYYLAVYILGLLGFWRNIVDYFGSQVVKHRHFGLVAHQPRATVQTAADKYCIVCLYVVKCVVHSLWLPWSVTTLS